MLILCEYIVMGWTYEKKNLKSRPRLVAEQRFENTVEERKQIGRAYGHDQHPHPSLFVRILGALKYQQK